MVGGVQFVLIGHDAEALEDLASSLTLVATVAVMNFDTAMEMQFDARHVLLIDIDSSNAFKLAHQIAFQCPNCIVATLSDRDRTPDSLMHIVKPLGYIDIQILLIRAGAVTF